jgi:hypothetical protein
MSDNEEAVDKLRRELHNSSGMAFVRRMRIRSSCLRTFTLNAYHLEDAFQTIGAKRLQLLHDDSGDISRQCNLVLTYLLHNFVASAKTIVDHTRIFITAFYSGTSVETTYKAKIAEDVAPDKVCRFVHDLGKLHAPLRDAAHVGVVISRYEQRGKIGCVSLPAEFTGMEWMDVLEQRILEGASGRCGKPR